MKIELIKLKFNDTHSYKYKPFTYCCNKIQNDKAIVFTGEDINDIGGEYMYVEKVKEQYTMHTRQVAHTRTVNGKSQTYYTTETYWTWDRVGSEDIKCKEISFCGVNFTSNKIDLHGTDYIDTINESSHVRYKYYGIGTEYKGTIFTDLRNKTISDNTSFYNNLTIDKTIERLESDFPIIIFWIFWVILICGMVFGFYYLDNRWLD